MRPLLSLLHRWFGLFIAIFLFISGFTGAIIAWDHELDAMIAPEFYHSSTTDGAQRTPLELANQLEAKHPELTVTFMPLGLAEGEALSAFVAPRKTSLTEEPAEMAYNQVGVNAHTGEIQGTRYWGAVSLTRENLLPFIYKLHYSLHIPDLPSGLQLGLLVMGIIGIVWVLDCFIALSISFPSMSQWKKSFAFRWRSNSQKLTFDLHRSGGVWVWLLLLVLAITSVSMNLGSQVVKPIVGLFSDLTPAPYETKVPEATLAPVMTREDIVARASEQAAKDSITAPLGGIYYSAFNDMYGVGFYEPGMGHGDMGLGNPWMYFDGKTGAYLGGTTPGKGTAGDIFMQAQFPLHSGRIIGVTGRIIVTVMGLAVAMLSVTGIIIWARKRKSRYLARTAKSPAKPDLLAATD